MINYYLLTKPGIILGNLLTLAAGLLLASKGEWHFVLFLATFLGLALIIASACVFNNYIDRSLDQKMERTKRRPLAQGLVKGRNAILFGSLLGLGGGATLFLYTNVLALFVASFGFFVYVFLYSIWKPKTIYAIAIGSIAGAVPPVVGYTAVANQLDAKALLLFALMVFWQMPHFYAIAIAHLEDYRRAKIPLLPLQKGILRTKIHMFIYMLFFIAVALMLAHYTGWLYFTAVLVLSLIWLACCLQGFWTQNDKSWATQLFRLSLIVIGAISLLIPLDVAL